MAKLPAGMAHQRTPASFALSLDEAQAPPAAVETAARDGGPQQELIAGSCTPEAAIFSGRPLANGFAMDGASPRAAEGR
jgi:hypothetical protein